MEIVKRGTGGAGMVVAIGLFLWAVVFSPTPTSQAPSSAHTLPDIIPTEIPSIPPAPELEQLLETPIPEVSFDPSQYIPSAAELRRLALQYANSDAAQQALASLASQSAAAVNADALGEVLEGYVASAEGQQALEDLARQYAGQADIDPGGVARLMGDYLRSDAGRAALLGASAQLPGSTGAPGIPGAGLPGTTSPGSPGLPGLDDIRPGPTVGEPEEPDGWKDKVDSIKSRF